MERVVGSHRRQTHVCRNEQGATALEHTIVLTIVALVCVGAWSALGDVVQRDVTCAETAILGRYADCTANVGSSSSALVVDGDRAAGARGALREDDGVAGGADGAEAAVRAERVEPALDALERANAAAALLEYMKTEHVSAVTVEDLEELVAGPPSAESDAARYLLSVDPGAFGMLDTRARGGRPDGKIGREDLEAQLGVPCDFWCGVRHRAKLALTYQAHVPLGMLKTVVSTVALPARIWYTGVQLLRQGTGDPKMLLELPSRVVEGYWTDVSRDLNACKSFMLHVDSATTADASRCGEAVGEVSFDVTVIAATMGGGAPVAGGARAGTLIAEATSAGIRLRYAVPGITLGTVKEYHLLLRRAVEGSVEHQADVGALVAHAGELDATAMHELDELRYTQTGSFYDSDWRRLVRARWYFRARWLESLKEEVARTGQLDPRIREGTPTVYEPYVLTPDEKRAVLLTR